MADFHRYRRRSGIRRWRSGIHRIEDGDYLLDMSSDILEKADIFNSMWRILWRLILAGQSAPEFGRTWGL